MGVTNTKNMIYESCFSDDNLWITVHKQKTVKGKLQKQKMNHMTSIMIDFNSTCIARSAKNCDRKDVVCRNCYARIQSAIHPQLFKKMKENSNLLNNPEFQPTKIDTINNCLRYISFGELQNKTQAINIFKHARKNKHLKSGVWTKQFKHMSEAIKDLNITENDKRYKNLNLIWSCSRINCMKFLIPKNFTKSFYVYRTETDRQEAITEATKQGFKTFNCNAISCHNCKHCYENHDQTIVMELLR